MSIHNQKNHYAAIEDVHVNLENRNHAFEEYGYGPLNPKEPSEDFWKQKAKVFNTSVEEAKKSRCGNCAAFNQSKPIMNKIASGLGPVGKTVAEKADLGFCEMFKFKCAAERTCDAWLVNGPIMEEGIKDYLPSADSINAFGRNAADTATFGGYKYARAGADYAVKKGMKALGLSNQDTSYKKELDQEKQKLARDDVKNPRASAAGDIAGMGAMAVAPEIPAVGAALGSALKGGETVSKIPYYARLVKRAAGLREEAPANNVGDGNIAGVGVGPQGEPGRPAQLMPMFRRGKFAGKDTFIVPSKLFHRGRMSKQKGKHWKTYFDEEEGFNEIRDYALKNPKKSVILQDEITGALYVARYGKEV